MQSILTAKGVSVRGDNIDTDRIIPARFLKRIGYEHLGDHLFEDDKVQLREKGITHPLDDPAYYSAEILFVNKNFGCGSSREHAPQALSRHKSGIKAIVGESFSEIFFSNCLSIGIWCLTTSETIIQEVMNTNEQNPSLLFSIDLLQKSMLVREKIYCIDIPDAPRSQLLSKQSDSISTLFNAEELIRSLASQLPYFYHWRGDKNDIINQ